MDTSLLHLSVHGVCHSLALYRKQISDSSRLEEFGDKKFKINENDGKFLKRVENTVGKGEIARYEQFLLFPQSFQKTWTADMALSEQGLTL